MRSKVVEARDALCAGDLDFVYTVDGLGVPAWTYPDKDVAEHFKPEDFSAVSGPLIVGFSTRLNELNRAKKKETGRFQLKNVQPCVMNALSQSF